MWKEPWGRTLPATCVNSVSARPSDSGPPSSRASRHSLANCCMSSRGGAAAVPAGGRPGRRPGWTNGGGGGRGRSKKRAALLLEHTRAAGR